MLHHIDVNCAICVGAVQLQGVSPHAVGQYIIWRSALAASAPTQSTGFSASGRTGRSRTAVLAESVTELPANMRRRAKRGDDDMDIR